MTKTSEAIQKQRQHESKLRLDENLLDLDSHFSLFWCAYFNVLNDKRLACAHGSAQISAEAGVRLTSFLLCEVCISYNSL